MCGGRQVRGRGQRRCAADAVGRRMVKVQRKEKQSRADSPPVGWQTVCFRSGTTILAVATNNGRGFPGVTVHDDQDFVGSV